MRVKLLMLVGFAALLLSSAEGLTQSGGPGDPRSSPDPRGGSPDPRGGPRGSPGGGLFGGSDPNQFFNQMTNGRDVWLRTETDPRMQRIFDRIAAQIGATNGQITRQQYMAYQEQRAADRVARGGPGMSPGSGGNRGRGGNPTATAEGMFLFLDKNGDGLLNFDEMPEELRAERERWDTDRNGFIDLNEFKAYFQARVQPPPQTDSAGRDQQSSGSLPYYYWDSASPPEEERKPPVVYRPGKLPKELPSWFAQYDTDQDGQIGLYEWRAAGRSLSDFDEIDRNKDGFLTVDEVLRFANKGKENGGQSPGAPPYSPGQFGGWQFGGGQFGPGNWGDGSGNRNFGRGGGGPPGGGRDRGGARGGRGGGRNRGGPGGDY